MYSVTSLQLYWTLEDSCLSNARAAHETSSNSSYRHCVDTFVECTAPCSERTSFRSNGPLGPYNKFLVSCHIHRLRGDGASWSSQIGLVVGLPMLICARPDAVYFLNIPDLVRLTQPTHRLRPHLYAVDDRRRRVSTARQSEGIDRQRSPAGRVHLPGSR
jgi:hypothetical protein